MVELHHRSAGVLLRGCGSATPSRSISNDDLGQRVETSDSWTDVIRRDGITCELPLMPPGQPGEDCLKLRFHLSDQAELILEGDDLRTGAPLKRQVLGTVR